MTYAKGNRIHIKPLGVDGTVRRVRDDGQYTVMADCATQEVVWAETELEPPRGGQLHTQFSSLNDD